ncbi:hypothetical protein ACGFMK_27280 [Amycolatopsis sp. NPDC049252]
MRATCFDTTLTALAIGVLLARHASAASVTRKPEPPAVTGS